MKKVAKASDAWKKPSYWIKIAITLLIMVAFQFIPPFGGITALGVRVIGVFVGAIVGWCICDTIWPSLLACLMLGLSGYQSISDVISSAAGNMTMLQVLFIFFFSGVILATGFGTWFGQWLVSRKFLQGRPWALILFILLAMYLLAPFTGVVCLILLWDIVYIVAEQVNMEGDNKWPAIMVYSIFYVVPVGIYYNFAFGPLAVFGLAKTYDKSIVLDGYPFIIYGLIVSTLLLVSGIGAIFLIFKPDVSKIRNSVIEPPPPMDKKQKITGWILLAFIVLQIVPSCLPASWGLTKWLDQFGIIGTTFAALIVCFVIRIDGKPLCTISEAAKQGIAWGPIFMMSTALVVASALTSEGTNVTQAMTTLFKPIFTGLSPFAFGALIILFTLILTNFMNNIVCAALFLPILYSVAPSIGINPYPLVVVMCYSTYCAVLLPSANPIAALMFGETDKISSKDIFKFGSVSMVTAAIILIFVAFPLAQVFYK